MQFEVRADAGAQIVDTQIDGAQLAKAVQALQRRLVHVACAYGGHDGQPAHGVQAGADDAAVDPVESEVPHQLRAHVDARDYAGRLQRSNLQAQNLVEDNALFKNGFEAGDKFFFKHHGRRGSSDGGRGCYTVRC